MNDMTIYEGIHPTLQAELKNQASEVQGLIRKTSDDLYRIGEILSDVKSTLHNKNFARWCESEVGIKKTTAYRYLSIYERFSDNKEIVSKLDPGVLMDLSVKSTPQMVVDKVVEKAESGEQVDSRETKRYIAEAKQREKEIATPPKPDRPQDKFGNDIPESIESRFQLEDNLAAIKLLTAKIQEHTMILRQDGIVKIDHQQMIDRSKWIYDEVDRHHPIFVCKTCAGAGWDTFSKRCEPCKGQGWILSTSS